MLIFPPRSAAEEDTDLVDTDLMSDDTLLVNAVDFTDGTLLLLLLYSESVDDVVEEEDDDSSSDSTSSSWCCRCRSA